MSNAERIAELQQAIVNIEHTFDDTANRRAAIASLKEQIKAEEQS